MKQIYHEAYSRLYEEAYRSESTPAYSGEKLAYAGGGPASDWRESEIYQHEAASAHAAIREMIERVDTGLSSNLGLRLRADAKLFLLTNLTEMIAKPIIDGKELETSELFSAMEADLQLVATRAAQRCIRDAQVGVPATVRPSEIAAHFIIDAVSRNWKEIKLLGAVWG